MTRYGHDSSGGGEGWRFLCVTYRTISTLPTEKSRRQDADLISDHRAERIRSGTANWLDLA